MLAWAREDFEAMHRLIANRSRELYPQQSFINQYTAAHSVLRFNDVSYEIKSVEYQGDTAIHDIRYRHLVARIRHDRG